MRLSLVFPSWTFVFGNMQHIAKGASIFPPLNLALLAAIARHHGHDVQLIDAEAQQLTGEQVAEKVAEFKPDLIGMTATTPSFHIVKHQAKFLKDRLNTPIVIGGPHVTYFAEKAMEDVFDILAIGEWEAPLPILLKTIEENGDLATVPSLIFRKNGNIVKTDDKSFYIDLDQLPFPARDLLNSDDYWLGTLKGKQRYTTVMMSTGCPFKCAFCATTIYGRKVKRRSIENVIKELDHIVNDLKISHVYFIDGTLTVNRKFIMALCDAIEASGLKFTWEGGTRANLVDRELLARMKECGLIRISFGLETADPDISRIIMKEVPLESYIDANKLTNELGIETINSVMLGLPGDTKATIRRTIDFVANARDIHHATFGIAMPYPGSPMYDMAVNGQHGLKLLTDDFSEYQRYNHAVMEVNDLMPADLVRLQKVGLLRIYTAYWRIIPVMKRFGIIALIKPAIDAVLAAIMPKWLRKTG